MNKIFTLFAAVVCLTSTTKAQVILNEVYTHPGNGNHEFFELYNTSSSSMPISMDGYTVMSYFEEGTSRGFYVLDLPNLSVAPRGYFTGASAIPFNYQGTINSNAAQFSWNDPVLPSNFGYLLKCVYNGNNFPDGNGNYDMAPIPADFNDFFSRRGGNGASYNALIFKNGVFINSFFGGTGGSSTMPAFITSMPNLRVEELTSVGSNFFNINFSTYANRPIEYVGQDVGSNNGFIRSSDGTCGTWTKSSADVNHTPGVTNGKPAVTGGSVTVAAFLVRDYTNMTANINYNISSAPSNIFPIEMEIYLDNGTVPGELDAADTFVESKIENSVSDGPFTTVINPYTENVLLAIKQPAGCFDKIMYRDIIGQSTLPLTITAWEGNKNGDQITLNWALAENELAAKFEVQRSIDGASYSTVGLIFSTEIFGNEGYSFSEKNNTEGKTMYRLKMIEKHGNISYTKTLMFDSKNNKQNNVLQIMGNPVTNKLMLNYKASQNATTRLAIYNTMGQCIFTQTLNVTKGNNVWDVPVDFLPANSNYMAVVNNGNERSAIKFLRK